LKSLTESDATTVAPPHGEGFPFPTFLINANVTKEDLQKWFEIQRNFDYTKAEIKAEEETWVATQDDDIKEKFDEWRASIDDFIQSKITEADEVVSGLSESAQAIYEEVKKIRLDDSITRVEECEKIRDIFQNADQLDLVELLRAVPGLQGRCFGPYPLIGGRRFGHRRNNTQDNNTTNNNNPSIAPRETTLIPDTTAAPSVGTTTASRSFLRRLFNF